MGRKILLLVCVMWVGLVFAGSAWCAATATAPTTAHVEPAGGVVKAVEGLGHDADKALEHEDPMKANLNAGTLVVTIVIFLCLLAVLRKWAWKPILSGLKNREQAIRDSIEAAQRAKADAERTTKELEAKMNEVQRQAAQQLSQAKADAVKVADSIRAQAEVESLALKDRTLREIEAAKQQAVAEINTHGAELGVAVARKILQRNVTAEDQQRLVDESLSEMAKKN